MSWRHKKTSGLGALAVSVAMCCALAAWKWDFLMMAKDAVSNRMAKRCTVEDRVEQYGTVVRERLSPFFEKADVPWPARRLVLVGLKEERQLEVWGEDATGTLKLIRIYPVLGASGTIGPKLVEGDGQVPEGIYEIESLNPNSAFHLSLRVSYPNAFDRERAKEDGRQRLGSDIMIHGGTASAGCLAMGNEAAEDLFVMVALAGTANVEVILCPCDLRVKRHASNEVERMTALIGDMGKARRLIESTSTNAVDSEWVHQAERIFQRRNPASPPLSLSSNAIPAKTASRPVIKTTYKIKKTADGKLEKQVTTTEIPTDAGTNK